MDCLRTPFPGAWLADGDADNSLRLGRGVYRVCRQIPLCDSHLCKAFPHVQPPPRQPPLHARLPLFPGKRSQRMKSSLKSGRTIGQLSKAGSSPCPPSPAGSNLCDTAHGRPPPVLDRELRKPAAGRAGKSRAAAAGEDSPG